LRIVGIRGLDLELAAVVGGDAASVSETAPVPGRRRAVGVTGAVPPLVVVHFRIELPRLSIFPHLVAIVLGRVTLLPRIREGDRFETACGRGRYGLCRRDGGDVDS
jgi:hypothetical protein